MSKGQIIVCNWLECDNSFEKKNRKHQYCCNSCRKKSNRTKNGVPLVPSFISGKVSKVSPVVRSITNHYNNPQIVQIPANRTYRAASGSSYGINLMVLGLGLSALTRNATLKRSLVFGAVGYALGKSIDNQNNNLTVFNPVQERNYLPKKITPTLPIQKRIISGKEYREADVNTIGLRGEYLYLLGDPADGFYALLTGLPGNGKSTFAVKFAEYFNQEHGKVLYMASEQNGINKPLQSLLQRYNATFDIDTKPSGKVSQIIEDAKGYDLLILDSVNNMRLMPDDINKIKKAHPTLSIIAIMQSVKDGGFKGSQEFLHDCDIRLNCERPKVKQTKSRYAPPSEIVLFTDVH